MSLDKDLVIYVVVDPNLDKEAKAVLKRAREAGISMSPRKRVYRLACGCVKDCLYSVFPDGDWKVMTDHITDRDNNWTYWRPRYRDLNDLDYAVVEEKPSMRIHRSVYLRERDMIHDFRSVLWKLFYYTPRQIEYIEDAFNPNVENPAFPMFDRRGEIIFNF